MTSALFALLAFPLLAAPFDDAPAIEMRYTGALSKATRAAEDAAVKRFNLYGLVVRQPDGGRSIAFHVSERGGGGWPWPESYGSIAFDNQLKPVPGRVMRLLFDYEGIPVVVPLPSPLPAYHKALKAGEKWTEGKEAFEVARMQKVHDHNCWQVVVSTNLGRKRTVWIDAETPLVVALEEQIFVGQGDEHSLTMQLESVKALDADQLAQSALPLAGLLKLQTDLARAENESRAELSAAQLKIAGDALPQLQKDSADTPFGSLVSAIGKDLKTQLQRTDEVARLSGKLVGKPAPKFALKLTDKTDVAADALADKIIVLHFWEYQGEPLVEPYGQVGYLDFLYEKRRKLGVQVYGVAVDSRSAEERSAATALKSIQKLKSFMNLRYPIAVDDGKLLARFGDPTKFGAKLPLWVVIGHDGKVAHYRTGFYKINPDEGLRELDEILVKLIREQRGKPGAGAE